MSEFGPVFITQNLIISSLLTKGKTGQSRSTNDFTDLKMHLFLGSALTIVGIWSLNPLPNWTKADINVQLKTWPLQKIPDP